MSAMKKRRGRPARATEVYWSTFQVERFASRFETPCLHRFASRLDWRNRLRPATAPVEQVTRHLHVPLDVNSPEMRTFAEALGEIIALKLIDEQRSASAEGGNEQ